MNWTNVPRITFSKCLGIGIVSTLSKWTHLRYFPMLHIDELRVFDLLTKKLTCKRAGMQGMGSRSSAFNLQTSLTNGGILSINIPKNIFTSPALAFSRPAGLTWVAKPINTSTVRLKSCLLMKLQWWTSWSGKPGSICKTYHQFTEAEVTYNNPKLTLIHRCGHAANST